MASDGYPEKYEKGFEITVDSGFDAELFIAGAKAENGRLLTNGGPNGATETIMHYIYITAFNSPFRFGYGNAMGVVLALFIAALSAVQFRLAKES